ncbi:sensor histidine kinase [Microbacterium sp.]|uniref:sensor histidine kinase n=1 Tax=Microbacterium sp. TaxID=51671 RepID=UPI0039E710E7
MDSTQLALIALAVGTLIGGALAALLLFSLRLRDAARARASTDLPDGTRAVLQGMDDVAVVVDSSLRVVAASAPAELFGMTEGETLAGDELRDLVRSARATGRPESHTLRLRRGSELRSVAARASVITTRLTLVVIRDITERERVEEMRRDFVANTSHELKTPVGAVTLLAEAIESAADDPEQVRHFAGRLTAEAGRLGQLTSRIMNLSRLQAADDLTELRDVAVDEVLTAAIESQAVAADAARIEVVRGGARGVYVRGDVQVLTEAFANLVANAIAYSPPGSPVGVGVKLVDDAVEIAVTDRGIGIPEGEQARVFERFYRADQARSRRTGGTGLGLSIVKHAIQRHGGDIELWSRPGRGSTFTVRLQTVAAPQDVPSKKRRRSKAAKGASGKGASGKGTSGATKERAKERAPKDSKSQTTESARSATRAKGDKK